MRRLRDGTALVRPCRVGDCDRDARARGLCKRHLHRFYKYGSEYIGTDYEQNPTYCTVPGCDGRARVHGWCFAHNARHARFGDVLADKPVKRRRPGGGRKPKGTKENRN